jgi:hypothetical protein
MTISQAQLRTLSLLHTKPACRVYRSDRAGDYTWVHDDTHVRLTVTLHRLFSSGYAEGQGKEKAPLRRGRLKVRTP